MQVQAELALQALLDDLHVQQAQEAHAEAEAEGMGGLGLPDERRVVERELVERLAAAARYWSESMGNKPVYTMGLASR